MKTWSQYISAAGFLLIMILAMSARVHAQNNFALTWYLMKDDNTFRSRNLYDEWINTFSVYAGKSFSNTSSSLRAYYNGDFSKYSNYEDRQNNSHQLGVALNHSLGSGMTGMLGLFGRTRRNQAQYMYYNTDAYNLYANVRYEPDLSKIYTAGISYKRNNFTEFSEIDNIEYKFFGRYQRFLQNRISLSGEVGLGIKNYVNQTVQNYFGDSIFGSFNQRYAEEQVSAMLLSGNFNIGKSLTERTGINLGFGGKRYIGDPIEAISGDVYYYTENDLYDDPYGYEDLYVSMALTRQFGVGFQMKLGADFQDKNYRGTPAFNDIGELMDVHRQDQRLNYYFIVTKKFITGLKFPGAIDGFFRFNIRHNTSNDPYYEYQDHLGMLGITLSR